MKSPSVLLLNRANSALLGLVFLMFVATAKMDAEGVNQLKIGNLVLAKDGLTNRSCISVFAQNGLVDIRASDSETFATSCYPEDWLLRGGNVISPAYTFSERHGIKLRDTSVHLPPRYQRETCIYHEGKFWKVSSDLLKPIYNSYDETKVAEIKGQAIWFDNREIAKLPSEGTPGKWHSSTDLTIWLAKNFHDDLRLQLFSHAAASLSDWQGTNFYVNLNDQSSLNANSIFLTEFRIHASGSSKVDVKSVDCNVLDTFADHSTIFIKDGHVAKLLRKNELADGKIMISAEIKKLDESKPDQPLKKQTPKGPTLEFKKDGDFDIKQPGGS